jgi:hypothetical protein
MLTFLAVVAGWVFFRAHSSEAAFSMLGSMIGMHGIIIPDVWPFAWHLHAILSRVGVAASLGAPASQFDPTGVAPYWIITLLMAAWLLPNTQQFLAHFEPALEQVHDGCRRLAWRPSSVWAVTFGLSAAIALMHLTQVSEFLYFQF